MDDLDHSMHIAEYDWTSFYEDSEECGLLQPSLAYLDNFSLSDSEDSGKSGSVFSTGQQKLQPSSAANSDEAESNAAGCCTEEGQINESGSAGDQDPATKDEEDSERWVKSDIDYPGGHRTEEEEDITSTLQNEQPNVQCSGGESTELKKEVGDVESDTSSIRELDPFSRNRAELNVNEPQAADGAVNEGVCSVRVETERWFVTVNDSPARLRVRATSVKKKRKQKKPCKNHMCRTTGRDKSGENGLELMKYNESEGGRETQSNQNLGGYPSSEENPESMQMGVISDLFQMSLTSGEEDNLSDKLVTSHITESTDRNKHDPSSSGTTLPDTLTSKDPSRLDSVESDELGDSLEFLSTHSYDSESYLSATESVEEPRRLLMEQLQSSSSLTNNNYLFNLTVNTDTGNTQDREMHLSCSVTATNCEGYESTEPTLTFPSAAQSANKMPDDASTCDNDTRCTLPSDSPGLQEQEINLSASGFSSGDQLSHPPVPTTLTPCPATDSPETYAEAAGHTRPVYAISAFWDEMEKLTINDILQLRMCRSPPAGDTQETPNVEDFPTNHSSLVDTVDYNSPDTALMDTSDTADSDYFTQPDESKPDRSSCEFSTSDFEEEYWQFLGASRNPSPDPQSKNQQRSCDSPFFAHEEEESTSSEGKETPVPLEDFAGECFEDEDSNAFIPSELSWPRTLVKRKSVRNIQALNTEDLSLQLLVGSDETSLFSSSSPSLEENVLLKAGDSLATPFLSNTDALDEYTQISFPEVFEYFLTEGKANRDSRCVTVYDPEDISVAPVFEYALCTFRDETFSSLCDSQRSTEKLIPIFSCSRPTIRELTFPNPDYIFLSTDCKEDTDISPIRVVSHSFIQGSDCGTSAGSQCSWKSFPSIRRIRFHDKGSIWCRSSGAWVFPVEAEKITIKKADQPTTVLTEWRASSTPSQSLSLVQERILETILTTRREGIFSTLKQSDMCLVCIAFASWVLTSSDPEAADAWKAALLANVSALSAIQYLRQYVKKKNPSQDDP